MKGPQWFSPLVPLTVVNVSNCLACHTRLSLIVVIPRDAKGAACDSMVLFLYRLLKVGTTKSPPRQTLSTTPSERRFRTRTRGWLTPHLG
ncbi:hypothetical protein V8E53_000856 [Lactarius tabidus]